MNEWKVHFGVRATIGCDEIAVFVAAACHTASMIDAARGDLKAVRRSGLVCVRARR